MTTDDATGMGLTGAWELSSYLQDRAGRVRDLRFTFRHYPDESHTSVPLRSVYDGLQGIFEGWGLDMDDAFALYEQGGLDGDRQAFCRALGTTRISRCRSGRSNARCVLATRR